MAFRVASAVFILIFCSFVFLIVALPMSSIYRHLEARRRFVTVEGVVVSSKVVKVGRRSYVPLIEYRYQAGGAERTGDRYYLDMHIKSEWSWTLRRDEAAAIVGKHPAERRIQVHYDPRDPGLSTLSLEPSRSAWGALLFSQPFVVLGIWLFTKLIAFPLSYLRRRRFLEEPVEPPWRVPTWGVLIDDGELLRIARRPQVFLWMGVGLFVASFPCNFLILFLLHSGAGTWAILAVGAVPMLTAAAAGVSAWKAGGTWLEIDVRRDVIVCGRPGLRRKLKVTEVNSWTLRRDSRPRYSWPVLALQVNGEDILVFEFDHLDDPWPVARKATEGFAKLTGRPAIFPQELPAS